MSIAIMANFPIAMSKGLKKSPQFNSIVQRPVAGKSVAAASLQPYPTWGFEFDFDRIQGNELALSSVLALFMGIHMVSQGRTFPFLFLDPQDSTVIQNTSAMLNVTSGAAEPMGLTGDGVSTQFQLARVIGGQGYDIIQNVIGTPLIYVNGTPTASYSISGTGVITFNTAPPNFATLQWAGNFYFYCRFLSDTMDYTRVFTQNSGTDLWDVDSIKFETEFQ
jgi:hypothetical protein